MFPPVTWTDESVGHIAKHDVTPQEVEDVLYGRPRFVAPGRDRTQSVFGTTKAGRYLVVIVSAADDGGTYIVTARTMTDSERRTFRRKGR